MTDDMPWPPRINIEVREQNPSDQMGNILAQVGVIVGTRNDGTQWWLDIDEDGSPSSYWRLPPGECEDPIELRTPEELAAWRTKCNAREEIYADHPIHAAWNEFIKENPEP
jgi:hypothetical protein